MIYYDKDTLNSTTQSTLTSKLAASSDEEEINADWESEYWSLTGMPIETLSRKKLEDFYTDCNTVKNVFKKSSENSEGIFGAEEVYDITSDINFSEALENMKDAMQDFANAVGGDVKSIFNGLDSEHIARTYTMAKNIVSTYRIKNEYAYYDIGTNIISYTPGLSGDEFMLIDFQKIKLKLPLEIYDNGRIKTYEDTDNDGIYDRNELGDEFSDSLHENTMKKKVNVTGFVKKMIERELYGNDEKAIKENQDYVKEVLAKVKYNIYNQRNRFDEENSDNNKQNWKEAYENNLNVDDETKTALGVLPGDSAKIQYLKLSPSRLNVELWKYKSNPTLKDTDFDGIDDGLGKAKLQEIERAYGLTEENEDDERIRQSICKNITYQMLQKDKAPKDNHFTGRMNTSRLSGNDAIEVDMNMDYRYFFLSNKLYFDELSTMSLLYANSIYMQNSGVVISSENNKNINGTFNNLRVRDLMKFYGFKDVRTYYLGTSDGDGFEEGDICRNYHKEDTHKGRVALGYKTIEYHGIYKNVISIVIRGTAEDDDWDSDFDMGDINLKRALDTKTIVSDGKENNTIEELTIDGSTRNSRIIDSYFANNSVLTYGSENKPLDYKKEYFNELKHFAYGYPDWLHKQHHAGFDIVANRILEVVNEYYEEVKDHFSDDTEIFDENTIENPVTANSVRNNDGDSIIDAGVCFWVTGHSMGAGVANLVAANLIDNGYKDNVYCYTFAAPNTFYLTDNGEERQNKALQNKVVIEDYKEPHGVKYRCIFNIVNADDFVPEVPMKDCNWTKYGRTASISFNANIPIKTIQPRMDETLTNTERFIYVEYKGNREIIKDIVDSFNLMFEDNPDNMRYDAYVFNNDYVLSQMYLTEPNIPLNTKPFQKREMINSIPGQYQMPAYFMNYLSFAMKTDLNIFGIDIPHPEFVNLILHGGGFKFSQMARRYEHAKDIVVKYNNNVKTPHYLETYYILTKSISANDFR